MHVLEKPGNERHSVLVQKLERQDWGKITVRQFAFNWRRKKDAAEIYKLSLNGDILGLIAFNRIPEEERIEIALLAVSAENVGPDKKYDRIAGTLIAFVCRKAIRNYHWVFPCISLVPKTELKSHYIKKYGMLDGGRQLYLEDLSLHKIIKEYLS